MFESAEPALTYITAGQGKFTIKNKSSGNKFTYRTKLGRTSGVIFIFNGALYLGHVVRGEFRPGVTGRPDSTAFKVLASVMRLLGQGRLPTSVEIWHEGTCGKCSRTLTNPDSIASGIGPICAGLMQ